MYMPGSQTLVSVQCTVYTSSNITTRRRPPAGTSRLTSGLSDSDVREGATEKRNKQGRETYQLAMPQKKLGDEGGCQWLWCRPPAMKSAARPSSIDQHPPHAAAAAAATTGTALSIPLFPIVSDG
ncbi:hypothetical protein C0Q70_06485 [Pomacea canaliculata]|uniref:Uncharacterized protein n=1 Tax=Pomacea canaliculata TaxID=400727 RepID=A0A2T7PP46_POMCA|nr:hypothetical protein C0Q70_06485 [Pomacea canaliculata]